MVGPCNPLPSSEQILFPPADFAPLVLNPSTESAGLVGRRSVVDAIVTTGTLAFNLYCHTQLAAQG